MKRNKHIDSEFNQVIILGLLLVILLIALIGIDLYMKFISGDIIRYLKIIVIIILIYEILKISGRLIENRLLRKKMDSSEFELMLKSKNFDNIAGDYYAGVRSGYYSRIFDFKMKNTIPFQVTNQLFVDLFCDCSRLSEKEIEEIEDKNFIVTHISIRRVISNWVERYDINRISLILDDQVKLAERFDLVPIKKAQLEKEDFWA